MVEEKKKDEKKFEDVYKTLQEKHKLPSFTELDKVVEISDVSDVKNPLRAIRKKIEEKLEGALTQLHAILQPETKLTDLQECKVFNEKEKDELIELFKSMMITLRTSHLLTLQPDEKKSADFIRDYYQNWTKTTQKQLVDVCKKLIVAWQEETKEIETRSYLG